PRLLGALLLLLAKRRLMDEQIRPLRRIHHSRTRPRVPGKHDDAPGTLRADDAVRTYCPPVRQLHRLTLLQLPPQVSFRNAGLARLVRIEPPRPLVLAQCVADGSPTVLGAKHLNLVRGARCAVAAVVGPYHVARFDLSDVDPERNSLDTQLDCLAKHFLGALRAIQYHWLGARLQPERTNQPDHSEKMVGVKMREEDLGQGEAHPVAHHLALGALAALEQERLALAHQRHRGDVALHGGTGGGSAEKRHAQHAAEYKGCAVRGARLPPMQKKAPPAMKWVRPGAQAGSDWGR